MHVKYIFLVDYENSPSLRLEGIQKLSCYDKVIIFLSENTADREKVEKEIKKIYKNLTQEQIDFIKCPHKPFKNMMDYQIIACAARNPIIKFCDTLFLVSEDGIFSKVSSTFRKNFPNLKIYAIKNFSEVLDLNTKERNKKFK